MLHYVRESFKKVAYPSNALCANISNIGYDKFDGNIFVHPFFVNKMLNHVDNTDFSENNVFLKKESVVCRFDSNMGKGQVLSSSLFKEFMASSENQMKYTFLVTPPSRAITEVIPDDAISAALTISPFSDQIELISKHAHILATMDMKFAGVYSGGELLITKKGSGASIVINLSSGTFNKYWTEDINTCDEEGNEVDVSPLTTALELTTKLISLAAMDLGLNTRPTDVRVEMEITPSQKFEDFVPKKPSLILGITNAVDKQTGWEEVSSYIEKYMGVTESGTQAIYKDRKFKSLSMTKQTKIRTAHSLCVNIVHNLIRPRVYSSRVECRVLVGVLGNAERVLGIIGGKVGLFTFEKLFPFIDSIRLDVMSNLYRELMRFSVSFDDLRGDSSNLGIVPDPSVNLLTRGANKNLFFRFEGIRFEGRDLVMSPFTSFTVGPYIAQGNFGMVHELTSFVENGYSTDVPDLPLVVKINPVNVGPHNMDKTLADIPSMDMLHQNFVPDESKYMDAFSSSFRAGIFLVTITEKMYAPDFTRDQNEIFRHVMRDIIRLVGINKVHYDVKPDNIMKKSDGTYILVDYGLVGGLYFPLKPAGTMLYAGAPLNTLTKVGKDYVTPLFDIFSLLVSYIQHAYPALFRTYYANFLNTREEKIGLLQSVVELGRGDNLIEEILPAFIKAEREVGELNQKDPINELLDYIKSRI